MKISTNTEVDLTSQVTIAMLMNVFIDEEEDIELEHKDKNSRSNN